MGPKISSPKFPNRKIANKIELSNCKFTKITNQELSSKIFLLSNGNILSITIQGNINIYQLLPNKCIISISQPHNGTINDVVQLNNDDIVTIGQDNTIKIWKISKLSYKLIKLIYVDDTIQKVTKALDNRLISYNTKNQIQVWDSNTFQCLHTIKFERPITFLFETQVGITLTFLESGRLFFWNNLTLECVHEMKKVYIGEYGNIAELSKEKIIVGNIVLKILNIVSYQIETIISLKTFCYSMIVIDNETLLVGSAKGMILINISDNQFNQYQESLNYWSTKQIILVGQRRFISRSLDGSIYISTF